jgi:hypothetical protein
LATLAPACGSKSDKPSYTPVDSSWDSHGTNYPACRYSCAAFSRDGKYVLVGYTATRGAGNGRKDVSFPYFIALDAETGNEVNGFRQEKDDVRVKSILPLPDNRRAVVVDELGTLILVDYIAEKVTWQDQAFERIDNAAVSVDGKYLYVQGLERHGDHRSPARLKGWNLSGTVPERMKRDPQPIDSGRGGNVIKFTPLIGRGNQLALITTRASPYGETFVWDITNGEKIHRFDTQKASPFAVSPDARYILCHPRKVDVWLDQEEFTLWDVAAGRWETPTKILWPSAAATVVRKREKGNPVFVRFWDVESGRSDRDVEISPGSSSGVMLSSDSRLAFIHGGAINEPGPTLHVWNLGLAKELWQRAERPRR